MDYEKTLFAGDEKTEVLSIDEKNSLINMCTYVPYPISKIDRYSELESARTSVLSHLTSIFAQGIKAVHKLDVWLDAFDYLTVEIKELNTDKQ